MRNRFVYLVSFGPLVLLGASLTYACGRSEPTPKRLPGEGKVLARVAETSITQYELDRSIERTFGKLDGSALDAAGRRKVLESLVLSRAIALASERELDEAARTELGRSIAAYREEQLVKQYLAKHAPAEPVSAEMVEAYYRRHPDRFGAKEVRHYEMLATDRELLASERDVVIKGLVDPYKQRDWAAWTRELRRNGLPISYLAEQTNVDALQPRLRSLIAGLQGGQTSRLTFVQNRAYVVRVLRVEQTPPAPLIEVTREIRQTLAPLQVQKALRSAGEDVLKQTRVEYSD